MLFSKADVGAGDLNLRMVLNDALRVLQHYQNLAARTFQAITRIQNAVAAHGWDTATNVSAFGKIVDESDVDVLEDVEAVSGHSEKDFRSTVLSELRAIRQTLERRSQGIRSEPAVSSERLLTAPPIETTVATGNQVVYPAQPLLQAVVEPEPPKAGEKEKEEVPELRPLDLWKIPANTLLTAEEAAKATDLKATVFWKSYECGSLKAVHAGACSRFTAREIREYHVARKGQKRPAEESLDVVYDPEKIWTVEEVARRLKVSDNLVHSLCGKGKLKAARESAKKNARWLIREKDYQKCFVESLRDLVLPIPVPAGMLDLGKLVDVLDREGYRINLQRLGGIAMRAKIPRRNHAYQRFIFRKDEERLLELARSILKKKSKFTKKGSWV
jgi:hypothetical protein